MAAMSRDAKDGMILLGVSLNSLNTIIALDSYLHEGFNLLIFVAGNGVFFSLLLTWVQTRTPIVILAMRVYAIWRCKRALILFLALAFVVIMCGAQLNQVTEWHNSRNALSTVTLRP